MLSTNPRTHVIEFTKDRELFITEKQYKALKSAQKLANFSDALEIHDADTGKIIHDWLWKDFTGFRELVREDTSGMKWVCDFATRHSMHDKCECKERYWLFPVEFRTKLYELYPTKFPSTITEQEKQIILKSLWK